MSTDFPDPGRPPVAAGAPLTMREIATLLVRHYGFHDGKYDLLLECQFGVGAFGPTPESVNPAVLVSIAKIGLTPAAQTGPLTIDAAEVNPPAPVKKRKPAKWQRAQLFAGAAGTGGETKTRLPLGTSGALFELVRR